MISMRRLGHHGQWGNQLIQYAFLRTYAKRHRIAYQVPPWAGQYFFGHNDPPITEQLPQQEEPYENVTHERCFGIPQPPRGREYVGHDFLGWAQYHTSWYASDRAFIQGLFEPVVAPERDRVLPALDRLRAGHRTIVGLHLRGGDAGRMIFFLTPITWCLKWLYHNWQRFDRPTLFLAVENLKLVKWFSGYHPVIAEDLGLVPSGPPPNYTYPHTATAAHRRQMDFFPDWFLLQQSDVMLGAESTFSFSAAWFSRQNTEYWRPRLSTRQFHQEDPWNAPVSHREHLSDFPGIPGTQIDENLDYKDYWKGHKNAHPAVPESPQEIEKWMKPL